MKKTTTTAFTLLTQNELKNLTSLVKETIATVFPQPAVSKTFTAADLWNIQRQCKTRVQRRFI